MKYSSDYKANYKKPQIKSPRVPPLESDNLHANCTQIARKAVQQEFLCPLCSLWLNDFSAPAHERAPPAPAVYTRLSGAEEWMVRKNGYKMILINARRDMSKKIAYKIGEL